MYPISMNFIYWCMKLLNILNSDHKRNASECVEGMEKIWDLSAKISNPSIQNIYPVNCDTFAETLKHDKKIV